MAKARTQRWADPVRRDWLRLAAGIVAQQAVGCRKKAALRLRRSVDVVDDYCTGAPSNPVYRHDELIDASEHPEVLLAHARIVVERRMLEGKTVDELRAELREILLRAEPQAECRENMAAMLYLDAGQRAELRQAAELEAALQLRLCAIIDRLDELERGA